MIRIQLECLWCDAFIHPNGPMYAWRDTNTCDVSGPYCSRDCAARDAYGPAMSHRQIGKAALAKRATKAVKP